MYFLKIDKEQLKELLEKRFNELLLNEWWKEHKNLILNFLYKKIDNNEFEREKILLKRRVYRDNKNHNEQINEKYFLYKFKVNDLFFPMMKRLYEVERINDNEYLLKLLYDLNINNRLIDEYYFNKLEEKEKILVKIR